MYIGRCTEVIEWLSLHAPGWTFIWKCILMHLMYTVLRIDGKTFKNIWPTIQHGLPSQSYNQKCTGGWACGVGWTVCLVCIYCWHYNTYNNCLPVTVTIQPPFPCPPLVGIVLQRRIISLSVSVTRKVKKRKAYNNSEGRLCRATGLYNFDVRKVLKLFCFSFFIIL